jgi:hypothetical protein
LSYVVDKIAAASAKDGKPHDATLSFSEGSSGITIHCNDLPERVAGPKLRQHCEIRKYSTKANTWFGLVIKPADGAVRFGLALDYPWKNDSDMDAIVARMPEAKPVGAIREILSRKKPTKIGRNDPCPCNSGLKYKKCHLPKGGFR